MGFGCGSGSGSGSYLGELNCGRRGVLPANVQTRMKMTTTPGGMTNAKRIVKRVIITIIIIIQIGLEWREFKDERTRGNHRSFGAPSAMNMVVLDGRSFCLLPFCLFGRERALEFGGERELAGIHTTTDKPQTPNPSSASCAL